MKNLIACILFAFCCSCGSMIDEGYYKVDITYAKTLFNQYNVKSDATWKITDKSNGKYKMEVVGGSTKVDGKEKENSIVFLKSKKEYKYNCLFEQMFTVKIFPDGNTFEGYGDLFVDVGTATEEECNIHRLTEHADFVGIKIPDKCPK